MTEKLLFKNVSETIGKQKSKSDTVKDKSSNLVIGFRYLIDYLRLFVWKNI